MTQKTFDFFSDIDRSESRARIKPKSKKKKRHNIGQLGFEFVKTKRKSWPFCQHCRVRRAATQRWLVGCGTSLEPAMFQGKPICKVCFGRSEDEEPLSIDTFAERRNDYDSTMEGFSWSSDGDD